MGCPSVAVRKKVTTGIHTIWWATIHGGVEGPGSVFLVLPERLAIHAALCDLRVHVRTALQQSCVL